MVVRADTLISDHVVLKPKGLTSGVPPAVGSIVLA